MGLRELTSALLWDEVQGRGLSLSLVVRKAKLDRIRNNNSNAQRSLSVYPMPGTVLSTVCELYCLILTSTQKVGTFPSPSFCSGETGSSEKRQPSFRVI